VFIKTCLCL